MLVASNTRYCYERIKQIESAANDKHLYIWFCSINTDDKNWRQILPRCM